MGITEYLMIAAAASLVAGLLADAVCDSDRQGNALIIIAILLMLAAFFTVETPDYLGEAHVSVDVPREMMD